MPLSPPGSPTEIYRLLRIYSYYRLALAILLVVMFVAFRRAPGTSEFFLPDVYLYTAVPYALLNAISLVYVLIRPRDAKPRHVFALLMIDVAALVLVSHATGGINSGFGILLMVTVATGAVFVPGQIATLIAAVASLAVLFDTVYLSWLLDNKGSNLFPAGVLGALLFASSLAVQRLSSRLRATQELAQERAYEVEELQALNQLIIERMRTGILFIAETGQLRTINLAAMRLLELNGNPSRPEALTLPAEFNAAFLAWQHDAQSEIKPFRLSDTSPLVQLNFTRVDNAGEQGILAFVEDFSQVSQQAQQLKLMSLGRLTASIAHEIRNPLNSINHAAQLLMESELLDEDDRRLSEIVIANAARTNEVIENVLTLSRGTQPKTDRIVLYSWLHRMVDDLRLRHRDETIHIELQIEPDNIEIAVDTTHFRQVVTNLCENGLRYSERSIGRKTLLVRAYRHPETELTSMDIVDYGTGIPDKLIAHIFEPFFTTEHGGTGLGLYLSRELCEANRIILEYRRDQEGRSCFSLHFPHPDRRTSRPAA